MNTKKTLFETALVRGSSIHDAANEAGVSNTTAYRWLDEGSRARVESAQREAWTVATRRLTDRVISAIDTLSELLDAKSDIARLGAAKAILDGALKLSERNDIETRLTALEKLTGEKHESN